MPGRGSGGGGRGVPSLYRKDSFPTRNPPLTLLVSLLPFALHTLYPILFLSPSASLLPLPALLLYPHPFWIPLAASSFLYLSLPSSRFQVRFFLFDYRYHPSHTIHQHPPKYLQLPFKRTRTSRRAADGSQQFYIYPISLRFSTYHSACLSRLSSAELTPNLARCSRSRRTSGTFRFLFHPSGCTSLIRLQ